MYRVALLVSLLAACGSPPRAVPDAPPRADGSTDAATYTIGGTVTGLVSSGLVLGNGPVPLSITGDGPFVFPVAYTDGSSYDVTIETQPRGQVCDVTNGAGTIAHANVSSIAVACHGVTVSLAIDGATACSVRTDGTLWCWGQSVGPLGSLSPVQIGTGTDWASAVSPSCALKTDRTLWCWGDDKVPTAIAPSTTWLECSEGVNGRCGIHTDGTLWCQTASGWTQHGVGDTWTHVSTTNFGTCAIRADGTLWCEGDNSKGELCVGDTAPHTGLVQVGTETWKEVVVGLNRFACGIRSDDSLWCWGDNDQHRVDDTDTSPVTSPELRAPGAWRHVTLTQSLDTTCAVATDGTAWCWGQNGVGQLGAGDMNVHTDPVEVAGGHLWIDVQAGNSATCGIARNATVWCWGRSYFGIFGDSDGSQPTRDVPGIVPLH